MALHKQPQGAGAEVAADGSTSTSPMEDDGGTLLSVAVDDLGQEGLQGHHEEGNDDGHHFSSSSSTGNKQKQTSCLLPARSLRSTDGASHSQQADCGVRSLSFSKILSFRMWAPGGSSSSTCLEDYIIDQHQLEHDDDEADKLMKQVCRSQSVPATSVARRRSSGTARGKGSRRVADSSSLRRLRVVPLTLRVPLPPPHLQDEAASATADAIATTGTTGEEEEDQDIAAEEAVCRICMVALSEEAVFKLECCCKGELALAHRACAIKWFSIKGNGSCDVCSQEVLNLPVTLRRLPDRPSVIQAAASLAQAQAQLQGTQAGGGDPTATTTNTTRYRVWHGTPILIIVSMLAYFCFLEQLLVSCWQLAWLLSTCAFSSLLEWNMEQLLIRMKMEMQVGDHGTAALAISLPFACVLGLFSSLSTTKMVSRRYVWIYSAAQFLFIVLFTHIFYRYVRLQAVIAIILSAFAGFSVAICTNYSLLQILRWRARHAVASPTATATAADAGGRHRGSSPRDPPAPVAVAAAEVDLEIALPPPSAPAPAPA